jgi:predicted permease
MRWYEKTRLRLRSLARKSRVERELDGELRFHIEQQVRENLAAGMSPEEARFAALRAFGGIAQFKEECRDMRRLGWIENLWQDLRYGWRTLGRSPGFTAVAVISLAFGIGVNTAVFSLIDALLLKEVNVADPDSLVSLRSVLPRGGATTQFSLSTFERLRDQTHVFSGMIAWRASRIAVSSDGAPAEMADAGFYSGAYYSVLGVPALLGRTFTPADDKPGQDAVAVIGYRYWQTKFSGNPSVLNQTIEAKGIPLKIVGVSPPAFTGLSLTDRSPDITLPLVWMPRLLLNDDRPSVNIMARLQRGWTLSHAAAEVNVAYSRVLADTLDASLTDQRKRELLGRSMDLTPAGRGNPGRWRDYKLRLTVLMGVVAIVLLISCANVANLLLARAAARQREMAVRLAIGAGRSRLIRQLLTESILLAVLGGATGLWFAIWAHRALSRFLRLPADLTLDWRVLGFTAAVCLLGGIIFGLAPALRSTRIDLSPGLKERAAGTAGASWIGESSGDSPGGAFALVDDRRGFIDSHPAEPQSCRSRIRPRKRAVVLDLSDHARLRRA